MRAGARRPLATRGGTEPARDAGRAGLEPTTRADRRDWAIALGVFCFGALLIFTRRPDTLLNPQFQFEDGVYWYAQAHEEGALRALVQPFYRGYFVTVQRLAGVASQAVPLSRAPLVMNLLAILIGALPAAVIASHRFASVHPARTARMLAAFLYIGQPGTWTTMANMAHAQWPLALLAGILIVAAPPTTRGGRAFDLGSCALSGLSGPTSILLAPVALIAWRIRRTRWSGILAGVVAATAAIQAACLALSAGEQGEPPALGATPLTFLTIFVRRIVLEPFVGDSGNAWLLAHVGRLVGSPAFVVAGSLAGAGLLAMLILRSRVEPRLLLLYAGLIVLLGLARPPVASRSVWSYWDALATPGVGNRYFVSSVFATLTMIAALAFSASRRLRLLGGVALAIVLAVGVRLDWREPPLKDYGFQRYVAKYERALPGERVQFVTPPGWSFVLTKR